MRETPAVRVRGSRFPLADQEVTGRCRHARGLESRYGAIRHLLTRGLRFDFLFGIAFILVVVMLLGVVWLVQKTRGRPLRDERMADWKIALLAFFIVFIAAPVVLGLAFWIWSGIEGG